MSVTPSKLWPGLLLALAMLSGHRSGAAVPMAEVEDAVLANLPKDVRTSLPENKLRRKIALAFRSKRAGYCGKRKAPLTAQETNGQWELTLAGVREARRVAGHTNTDRIITLNMGLGRDSIAMLHFLIEEGILAEGGKLTEEDISCVVFSNLGAEWEHTYEQLPRIRALCETNGIRFIVLEKPPIELQEQDWAERQTFRAANPGKRATLKPNWFRPWAWDSNWKTWEARSWGTIEEKAAAGGYHLRGSIIPDFGHRSAKATIASRRGDCTDNHKIQPIRKLVRDLCWERFGVSCHEWGKMVAKGERLPHLNLIGIAADEASRAENGGNGPRFVTEAYPLIEMDISKAGEATVLNRNGFGDVRKSGCRMCPFQGLGWFYALRECYPEQWEEVVAYEAVALSQNPKMFVTGGRSLPEAVERWAARNPNPDIDTILDKSYSMCRKLKRAVEEPAAALKKAA